MYALQPFGLHPAPAINPLFQLLDSWSQEFDSRTDSASWPAAAAPPYELSQRDDQTYALTLAVPGFRDKDLSVEVEGDSLHVRGEQAPDAKDAAKDAAKNDAPTVRRFAARQFHRQFQLGEHVRIDDAKLADGLLTIQLSRNLPPKAKPRQIKIARG